MARQAAAGSGAVAVVSGEAGIGKTRFLTEFRKLLSTEFASATAACPEFAPAPLGPIQTLLGEIAASSRSPHEGPLWESADDSAFGKLKLFRGVSAALRGASRGRAVVVVLDDVQWADTATLELVQFLAGELSQARILIALAYRSEALSKTNPLDVVIARLTRLTNVQRFELDPLAPAAVKALIDATLVNNWRPDPDVIRDVRVKSEGNPLFAEELLKTAMDRTGPLAASPPASLRGLVLERLGRLGPPDLHLLEVAALIGRRFNVAFLERVSGGWPKHTITAFLRRAIDEHFLIEERLEPGWFSFRHALVREAILAPVLLIESRAMHLRIAQEIEREPDAQTRVTELSDHYWQAAAFAECARYAIAAADQARARHAYAEAAEQYERALACGTDGERRRALLHEHAAAAHTALGNLQKCAEHLEIAASFFERLGAGDHLIAVCLELASALWRQGNTDGAFAALARATDVERQKPARGLHVQILVRTAQLQTLIVGDWANAAVSLRDAEPLLDVATPRDLVYFYISRASLRSAERDRDGWLADGASATHAARASNDPTLIASALSNYGLNAMQVGRLDVAVPAFEEVVSLGLRFGSLYNITYTRITYAYALFLAGRLEGARAQVLEVLAESHDSLTLHVLTAQLAVTLSLVLRDEVLFERSDASAILPRVFAAHEPRLSTPLAAVMAEKHLADGNEELARRLLSRMLATLPHDELVCDSLLPVAVCCEREEVEAASALFAGWRQTTNAWVLACSELFQAYAAARFGSAEDVVQRADAAARRFLELGMPLLEAEAYVVARQFPRATVICERVGARRLPRRLPSSSKRGSTLRLTPREREISDLAMRGLSNRAIATELSLSERTVESHLRAAYVKFGVRSRAELLSAAKKEAR